MTRFESHSATVYETILPPPQPLRQVWVFGQFDGSLAALGADIEPYGYRMQRIDLMAGSPDAATMTHPDVILIEAFAQDASLVPRVRDGTAIRGRPPVLVIAHGLESVDRILALEAGADDCVSWPCAPRELVARIRAIDRRRRAAITSQEDAPVASDLPDVVAFAGWTIDRAERLLSRPGKSAETLPIAEFAVLDHLLRRPRKITSRETLLEATAPTSGSDRRNLRAVDIQVSRLRKRLEIDGDEIIRTVRGRGYMLLPPTGPA